MICVHSTAFFWVYGLNSVSHHSRHILLGKAGGAERLCGTSVSAWVSYVARECATVAVLAFVFSGLALRIILSTVHALALW